MKTREITQPISDTIELRLVSEVYDGEVLDTEVSLNDLSLCWITGGDIENFTKEFSDLVERYQI